MKIHSVYSTLFLLLISLIAQTSHSCTIFCLDKGSQLVVGSNFDWFGGEGLVIVNKRNVSKTAPLHPAWAEKQPAKWTSKYGSVTFNRAGRETPWGGMNEVGLVVTQTGLETTEYPKADSRPAIFSVAWKQYQLDNFSTVEEVIASDSQIRIAPKSHIKSHFLVSDRLGNAAIIEFLEGKMVKYDKETLHVKALSNHTYAESIKYWEQSDTPWWDPYRSISRFITSADMVKSYDPKTSETAVDYAFDILEAAELTIFFYSFTQWSIAYDIQNLRIYFRTSKNKKIRYINMSSFDFACKSPVKVLDVDADLSGDVTDRLINYTYMINRELVGETIDQPDKVLDDIAKYPETTVCTELESSSESLLTARP